MRHNFRDLEIWKDSFSIVKVISTYELETQLLLIQDLLGIYTNEIIGKIHSNQRMIGGLKRKLGL